MFVKKLLSAALLVVGSNFAAAQNLPQPEGEVILIVSGKISSTNVAGRAEFDRNMLEQIGMTEITTKTPWYDEEISFSGVMLKEIMQLVGAKGEQIKAIALNDYETHIPLADAWNTGAMLALKMNGVDMTVRDKGPTFIIYPYDSSPKLQTQTYYSRSAWQVAELVIE